MLNGAWFPIGIESLQTAICKVYSGKADIIGTVGDGGYQLFDFEQWVERPLDEGAVVIHAARISFAAPDVIRKPYNKLHIQKLPLNAQNLFIRDGYRCWYCGSEGKLTIDHIIPRCRGGKSNWKNLITCCQSCNNEKGDSSAYSFCRKKGVAVPVPVNVGCFPWLKELGKKYPSTWKKWLNFV